MALDQYEEVHLEAHADGREARVGVSLWIDFYNHRRPHQAMYNQQPMAVWRGGMDSAAPLAESVDMTLGLDNANALTTYRARAVGFDARRNFAKMRWLISLEFRQDGDGARFQPN